MSVEFVKKRKKVLLWIGTALACVAAFFWFVSSLLGESELDITKAEFKQRIDTILKIDSPANFEIVSAHDLGFAIGDYVECIEARYYPVDYERLKTMLDLTKWESFGDGRLRLSILSRTVFPGNANFNNFTFRLDDSTCVLSIDFAHE
ncbi:MAG: hypothetical protein E4G91_06865 [Candidatus Zixiibacteriota bacterium]|nr:MAG: hypothetical protein E4G91_06865 [candidate division Zixibacteria bacterium]